MEQICLDDVRKEIDKKYVGFSPNGSSVKPVHIAGGSLRAIYGKCYKSDDVYHMALVCTGKGDVPKGNDSQTIYSKLIDNDCIDESISEDAIDIMRNAMQRLVSVDNGVFTEGMVSYSAGSKYFLTRKRATYEDAGEFIASIIQDCCPELAHHVSGLLDAGNDPITALFKPILNSEFEVYVTKSGFDQVSVYKHPNKNIDAFLYSIKSAGSCLLHNIVNYSNPLLQLRAFNFFCIFNLMRYMMLLETFYCDGEVRPLLLDFSGKSPSQSSVARTSEISYTQIGKSINRFYSWAYAKWLKDQGYTRTDLINSETPYYKKNKKSNAEAFNMLWNLAKNNTEGSSDDDMYQQFGETMYDMLALEASSHPINYLRNLGTRSGILYPPDRYPNKRFAISQDVLEMLIKSCVEPKEIISGNEIRDRLWQRFGIIVGGSQTDIDKLQSSGMILQIDEKSLTDNFTAFSNTLASMGYAEIMADGVLHIKVSGGDL